MEIKLSPFVFWGQTQNGITLKVDLRNVENVEVNLTEDSLDFTSDGLGTKGLNKYGFHLDFYLPVDPEKSRYRTTELGVEFQIEKNVEESWPRLTAERLKLQWLKIDFDKFPVDDSEEEQDISNRNIHPNPDQASAELLRKLSKDVPRTGSEIGGMSLTQSYLFLYNLFQFVGYTYIFSVLSYRYFKDGEAALEEAVEIAGSQMIACQIVAVLEAIHPMIGLVKSSFVASLAQVYGRNFVLFCLVLQEPRIQSSHICFFLFVVWSSVEVIRYPFYLLQLVGMKNKLVTWLRYSIWIPTYPLGMMIEGCVVLSAMTYFAETGTFTTTLPNPYNVSFYFPYYCAFHMALLIYWGPNNLMHMHNQRQKQLFRKSIFTAKKKFS